MSAPAWVRPRSWRTSVGRDSIPSGSSSSSAPMPTAITPAGQRACASCCRTPRLCHLGRGRGAHPHRRRDGNEHRRREARRHLPGRIPPRPVPGRPRTCRGRKDRDRRSHPRVHQHAGAFLRSPLVPARARRATKPVRRRRRLLRRHDPAPEHPRLQPRRTREVTAEAPRARRRRTLPRPSRVLVAVTGSVTSRRPTERSTRCSSPTRWSRPGSRTEARRTNTSGCVRVAHLPECPSPRLERGCSPGGQSLSPR